MSQQDSPPDPPLVRPCDYALPEPPRPAGNVSFAAQIGLGIIAFWLASVMAASLLAASKSLVFACSTTLILLVGLSVLARLRWRWRGFPIGVVAALGAAALVQGLCATLFG